MTATYTPAQLPDSDDVGRAEAVLPVVRDYLMRHRGDSVLLSVADDKRTLELPRHAVELLEQVLARMAQGEGVSIVPANAELTTQQAAELMNVSRPYLIGLVDSGQIEHRLVGKHRRVRVDSLMRYMAEDDRRRRAAADELTQLGQEMGLV